MEDRPIQERDSCSKMCGKAQVPSEEEIRALDAMRLIKKRVREIRGRLSEISSSVTGEKEPGEKENLEDEMKSLKSKWENLERERKKASHERMVLLGHEDPADGTPK
jgi:predicted  nucleic acid-binding Zn-ribbon protein